MRTAEIKRKTKETDIEVFVKLDGEGKVSVNTGIGFFDHMLTALGVHSGIDMDVECTGDLYVDGHHTVEDVGICLGKAFADWATKQVLQDTARLSCQWTKRWHSAHWI